MMARLWLAHVLRRTRYASRASGALFRNVLLPSSTREGAHDRRTRCWTPQDRVPRDRPTTRAHTHPHTQMKR